MGCEALYVHIVMEGCQRGDGSGGARARGDENARPAPDRLGGRVFEKADSVSSRVVLHFSKEGSDMLFEWLWKSVSRRLQLVTQRERLVLGSCSCYFRSCSCVAQFARDESGRRSCRPDLTSFRTVNGASSHMKLSGQSRARDHGCQDRKLLRREAKQLVRKSAWLKCPEPDNISRERPSLQGTTRQTLQELQRRRDQEVVRPLSQEVLEFDPERPVILDRPTFLTSLKSAPRGSSPGPGGCTYFWMRVTQLSCCSEHALLSRKRRSLKRSRRF